MHTMMTQHETFRIFSLGTNIYFLQVSLSGSVCDGVARCGMPCLSLKLLAKLHLQLPRETANW